MEQAAPSSRGSDIDICEQEAALLKKLQEIAASYVETNDYSPIRGVRVVYFNKSSDNLAMQCCDHHEEHNSNWNEALTDRSSPPIRGSLEAGTITSFDTKSGVVTVQWDCGTKKNYPYSEWCQLRVYRLGPAGYLGQMIYCDKCLEPSKGFVFRLIGNSASRMECYDLCVRCYIEFDGEYNDDTFQCLIPSEDTYEQLKNSAQECSLPRSKSDKYTVLGIFKEANVEFPGENQSGTVIRIVHGTDSCHDLKTARHYESCAEIKPSDTGPKTPDKPSLVYRKAGSGGEVEVIAIKPGFDSHNVPIEHFPTLGDRVVFELFAYKQKIRKVSENCTHPGSCEYFIRNCDGHGDCIIINGTNFDCINHSPIWNDCENIKIIVIILSDLDALPDHFESFSNSIDLVSLQNNRFTSFPEVLLKMPKIKHLVLFGNQVSRYPEDLAKLTKLERVKLGSNKIQSLPNIFGSFKFLTDVMLNNNDLTRLPPLFADLKHLKRLDLSDNRFTCIPTPLLGLPKLKFLYMHYNRIHKLSPLNDIDGSRTYKLLTRLEKLTIRGNPVYIQQRYENSNILFKEEREKFFELDQIPGPIPKALRVLVLGRSGAGKTSIVDALSFDKYVTPILEVNPEPTIGIKQFSIPFKMKDKDNKDVIIELRLWDFAGQESYLMMNSLFVTNGTLIWIAVNFNEYNEKSEKSFNEHVGTCLQQVITSMTKAVKPVVWVIGTHTDKCSQSEICTKQAHIKKRIELEYEAFEKKIEEELETLKNMESNNEYQNRSPCCVNKTIRNLEELKQNKMSAFMKNNLKIICLNNTYGFSGYEDLRENLTRIPKLPSFQWLSVQLTIEQQKTCDQLRQKAEDKLYRGEAPVSSKDDDLFNRVRNEDDFFKYLHQTGEILISKSDANETVLLHTEWLINLLKKVFHHNFEAMIYEKQKAGMFHCLREKEVVDYVRHKKTKGIVSEKLLNELWKLKEKKNNLYEFLKSCGIMYKIAGNQHLDPPGYLFPWLASIEKKFFQQPAPSISAHDSHILVSYGFSPCIPTCFIQELAANCQINEPGISINKTYKNAFTMHTTREFTDISAIVSSMQEKKSLCGEVHLRVTCSGASQNAHHKLWFVMMKIIKEMEAMLASWAFYSSLQRKVHCQFCEDQTWNLVIKEHTSEAATKSALEFPYMCQICTQKSKSCLMAPPSDLLLKKKEYIDRDEYCLGIQPQSPNSNNASNTITVFPTPSTQDRNTLTTVTVNPPYMNVDVHEQLLKESFQK